MSVLSAEQRKAHNRTYYLKNKERQVKRQKDRRAELRAYVLEIKLRSSCKVCGESHPATLDFHHRNPSDKVLTVAEGMNRQWSLQKLEAEINKCDILCANCHRKLHWLSSDNSTVE